MYQSKQLNEQILSALPWTVQHALRTNPDSRINEFGVVIFREYLGRDEVLVSIPNLLTDYAEILATSVQQTVTDTIKTTEPVTKEEVAPVKNKPGPKPKTT